jgi:hypothetical protein
VRFSGFKRIKSISADGVYDASSLVWKRTYAYPLYHALRDGEKVMEREVTHFRAHQLASSIGETECVP